MRYARSNLIILDSILCIAVNRPKRQTGVKDVIIYTLNTISESFKEKQ